jgi:hypothetical protein
MKSFTLSLCTRSCEPQGNRVQYKRWRRISWITRTDLQNLTAKYTNKDYLYLILSPVYSIGCFTDFFFPFSVRDGIQTRAVNKLCLLVFSWSFPWSLQSETASFQEHDLHFFFCFFVPLAVCSDQLNFLATSPADPLLSQSSNHTPPSPCHLHPINSVVSINKAFW